MDDRWTCGPDARVTVWAGPADAPVSRRFIDAVAAGEVTEGGMAEAGWFELGEVKEIYHDES